MYLLVKWSGGLGCSVYGASFIALFGISVFVPKELATKILLFLTALAFGVALVVTVGAQQPMLTSQEQQKHDTAVLFLSLIAYVYSMGVKSYIENVGGSLASNKNDRESI